MPHEGETALADGTEAKGWSTRELAEMTGTTVKSIRHYHRVGVLPEAKRRSNGYKSYGPEHLARLLDVLRMRDIGIPLAQILVTVESEGNPAASTRRLLADVDASILRLQAIRADLLATKDADERDGLSSVPTDGVLPERVMHRLVSRHFSAEAMATFRAMSDGRNPIDAEFERLSADADEATIDDLASRMAPHIRQARSEHPMPENVVAGDRGSEIRAARSMGRALSELYSTAQIEVIRRALAINDECSD